MQGTPGDSGVGYVVERYRYDPYGKVTVLHGEKDTSDPENPIYYDKDGDVTEWDEDTGGSDWDNEILYCGYRYDPETALYHVRERMYHPTLGRWLQRDPIGYVDGMSLYEYVGSCPLAEVDPLGLLVPFFPFEVLITSTPYDLAFPKGIVVPKAAAIPRPVPLPWWAGKVGAPPVPPPFVPHVPHATEFPDHYEARGTRPTNPAPRHGARRAPPPQRNIKGERPPLERLQRQGEGAPPDRVPGPLDPLPPGMPAWRWLLYIAARLGAALRGFGNPGLVVGPLEVETPPQGNLTITGEPAITEMPCPSAGDADDPPVSTFEFDGLREPPPPPPRPLPPGWVEA